jgi:hypothetical protein
MKNEDEEEGKNKKKMEPIDLQGDEPIDFCFLCVINFNALHL